MMKGFLGCLLVGVLLVSSASAGLYGKNSNVVQLTTENFATEVFGSNDVWMMEFYAPWCGHCKSLAPQYEAAATKLKGLVKLGAVDCDVESNKQLAQYFNIQGFPTLKIFSGEFSENPHQKGAPFKAPIDYQGQRTSDGIVAAVMGHLKYFGEQITENNLEEFIAKKGNKVLLLSEKKKTTGLYKALSGHFNGRLSFGQGLSSLGEKFGVEKFPALLVINEEGEATPYQGKLSAVDLIKFLEPFGRKQQAGQEQQQQQKQQQAPQTNEPAVYELTAQEDFENHCSSGICVIAFLNTEQDDHSTYLSVLKSMSEEYVKYFKFMWLDGLKFQQFSTEFLGSAEDLPRMVVFSPGKKLYTPFVGAFSEGSVKTFLGKVLHGKKRSVPLDAIPSLA